jgi:hypothetical protein
MGQNILLVGKGYYCDERTMPVVEWKDYSSRIRADLMTIYHLDGNTEKNVGIASIIHFLSAASTG